jgi:MFS family permease
LKFWGGETISLFGSQITLLALPLTAVLLLDATPGQMGILNASQTAPFLLLSLFAGIWVDRKARRPILAISNLARTALLASVPLLFVSNMLRIEYLYVIAFLIGGCMLLFELAYQSYLPRLVDRSDLVEANGKLTATASITEIAGPGLAGLLVEWLTAPLALFIDAATFLIAGINLLLIRRPEPAIVPEPGRSLRNDIAAGFRCLFGNHYIRAVAGEAATNNFFWHGIQAVFVVYAVRELGLTAGDLGIILSISSVGGLVGVFLTVRAARRFRTGPTIIGAVIIKDSATLLLPFIVRSTSGPTWMPAALLALTFFIQGMGVTGCNVHTYSLRQALIPDHLLGRTNAAYRLLSWGPIPLGSLLGGFLGTQIGLRPTLLVCAIGLLFTWLWLYYSPIRTMPQIPAADDAFVTREQEPAPAAA